MKKEYGTHCQICERDVKARTGVIAHHGYTRPYQQGWQSASCFGARWRPYEVACDALPPAIERLKQYIVDQKARIKEFSENPPAELTTYRPYREPVKHTRPEGFNTEENEKRGSFGYGQGYEMEHHSSLYQMRMGLKDAERTLPRLEKRLADWQPVK